MADERLLQSGRRKSDSNGTLRGYVVSAAYATDFLSGPLLSLDDRGAEISCELQRAWRPLGRRVPTTDPLFAS